MPIGLSLPSHLTPAEILEVSESECNYSALSVRAPPPHTHTPCTLYPAPGLRKQRCAPACERVGCGSVGRKPPGLAFPFLFCYSNIPCWVEVLTHWVVVLGMRVRTFELGSWPT